LQVCDWPKNKSFILGLDFRKKKNKGLNDFLHVFHDILYIREIDEGRQNGVFSQNGDPTLFSIGSFLHFPSCVHYFHFVTHSDNLLCLKLH
jgi:hypothetical protein